MIVSRKKYSACCNDRYNVFLELLNIEEYVFTGGDESGKNILTDCLFVDVLVRFKQVLTCGKLGSEQ